MPDMMYMYIREYQQGILLKYRILWGAWQVSDVIRGQINRALHAMLKTLPPLFFFFFCFTMWLAGYWFPDQELNWARGSEGSKC